MEQMYRKVQNGKRIRYVPAFQDWANYPKPGLWWVTEHRQRYLASHLEDLPEARVFASLMPYHELVCNALVYLRKQPCSVSDIVDAVFGVIASQVQEDDHGSVRTS